MQLVNWEQPLSWWYACQNLIMNEYKFMNACNPHVFYIHINIQHSAPKANLIFFWNQRSASKAFADFFCGRLLCLRLLFRGHSELQFPGTYLPQECLAHLILHTLKYGQHSTEQGILR